MIDQDITARLAAVEAERDEAERDEAHRIIKVANSLAKLCYAGEVGSHGDHELIMRLNRVIDTLRTVEDERNELQTALERYGEHRPDCHHWVAAGSNQWTERECTCGLTAALDGKE
jgi:hypothetical protein